MRDASPKTASRRRCANHQTRPAANLVDGDERIGLGDQVERIKEQDWDRAIDQDSNERDHAHVAELAAPDGWGDGVRLIVRREFAHAGAPMRLLDHEGNRYQVLITYLND